jgi:hypothetical protein
LVPHCDVVTAVLLGAGLAGLLADGLLELLLLHPAATSAPTTVTSTAAARGPGACLCVLT